jgi:2-iminobutanoate/2-iminopropanoate deaminase
MPVSRRWNPPGIAAPAYGYSHAVLTTNATKWLHLAGQIGIRPDRSLPEGLEAQLDQCFMNIETALTDAGMTRENLVKLTIYLTDASPDSISTYRARRDAFVGRDAPPAATLIVVVALAGAGLLVEVDAIAAS